MNERTPIQRFGMGGPNESKFGMSQAVRCGSVVEVAGQVGRDNRSGLMLPAETFGDHVQNAVSNVLESIDLALGPNERAVVIEATVFVPSPPPADVWSRIGANLTGLGATCAVTAVGIPALSFSSYEIEISATAFVVERPTSTQEQDAVNAPRTVPQPPAIARVVPGSAAVVASDVIRIGAHFATDEEGSLIAGSAAQQLGTTLRSIDRTLGQLGTNLSALTSTHMFLVAETDIDFEALCEEHRTLIADDRIAGTLIIVDRLPLEGAAIMMSATASLASLEIT